MKIFEGDFKTNFVDENNLFVGFDNNQQCCEDFGWGIVDELKDGDYYLEELQDLDSCIDEEELSKFNFDKDFFNFTKFSEKSADGYYYDNFNGVIFKLVDNEGNEKFLILYNNHNGYYSHGFAFGKTDVNGITYHFQENYI